MPRAPSETTSGKRKAPSVSRALVWLQAVVTAAWILFWGRLWWPPIRRCAERGELLHCRLGEPALARSDAWFWAPSKALGLAQVGIAGEALWSILIVPILAWLLLGLCAAVSQRLWSGLDRG